MSTTDGYSPPETAVEATPETTPLKDSVRSITTVPTSSTAMRAIWNTSQPSSPARGPHAARQFNYPSSEPSAPAIASQRLIRMVGDRMASQSVVSPADLDASQEDQEVRVINSRPMAIPLASAAAAENEMGDNTNTHTIDFETEGSPCAEGGLHLPVSRSVVGFARQYNCYKLASIGLDDVSAGTTPEGAAPRGKRLRRFNTWPRMNLLAGDFRFVVPGKGAAKQAEESRNKTQQESVKKLNDFKLQIRKDLNGKLIIGTDDKDTQTVSSYSQPYDRQLSDLFQEELKLRAVAPEKVPLSPNQLLEQLIESCATRHATRDSIEYHESLHLLHLQLQYERHRREVHADRNRRLLGISRQIHQYEQNLATLQNQVSTNSIFFQFFFPKIKDFSEKKFFFAIF